MTSQAVLFRNARLLDIWFMITSGADFSGETVGDFQAVSSIDGFPDKPYLAEAWYEQTFADETISVLAGLFDTNSEFDTVEASDLFFNASRANGTEYAGAGRNGTGAYPITPLAVRLKWSPSDTLELRVAITEGTPRDPDNLDKTTIDFANNLTEDEQNNIIQYLYYYNGGGVAAGDVNNDGLPDLYFTSTQGTDKIYLNKGDILCKAM